MSALAVLAVFSGLSLNPLLQFGLGIRNFEAEARRPAGYAFFQCFLHFVTVLLLWLLFACILSPLSLGFFEYFLIFPLIVAVRRGVEAATGYLVPPGRDSPGISGKSVHDGLAVAALFLTLRLADSFAGAAVLSLGFSLGGFAAARILNAIYKRSSIETIPPMLRGMPLLLISMGLLSLISSSVAVILLRVLGI
jgi:electron transport complex protein RnfA